jgi:hypothetical protein
VEDGPTAAGLEDGRLTSGVELGSTTAGREDDRITMGVEVELLAAGGEVGPTTAGPEDDRTACVVAGSILEDVPELVTTGSVRIVTALAVGVGPGMTDVEEIVVEESMNLDESVRTTGSTRDKSALGGKAIAPGRAAAGVDVVREAMMLPGLKDMFPTGGMIYTKISQIS